MCLLDKIMHFVDLDSLKYAIEADIDSRDILAQRYCVRFIMLNNFDVFTRLTKYLYQEKHVNLLNLDNLTYGEDKTLTIDKLSESIKNCKLTTLVTPFSEIVRFYKETDFNGLLNDIILTEDTKNPHKRIYIPIIGLHNRFTNFLENFGRIAESAPIWQYYTEKDDKVTVYVSKFIGNKLPNNNICIIHTMREWLRFWKQQAPKEKILCCASPIINNFENAKPDSIFSFHPINNAYEFIRDFLDISLPIVFIENDKCYWEKLLTEINNYKNVSFSFTSYVFNHFNRKEIGIEDIIELWADNSKSDYDRWLLKNLAIYFDIFDENPYLKICIKETNQIGIPESLFVNIAERIFYANNIVELEKYYNYRRNVINKHSELFLKLVPPDEQKWIKEKIIEIAQNDETLSTTLKYCTGVFKFERELFLGWYINRSDKVFGTEQLQVFYPELYDYLYALTDIIDYRKSWVKEYLESYRDAKLNDIYSENISNVFSTHNKDEESFYNWYYAFNESHDLLNIWKNNNDYSLDKTYWIDGLGAEFLPLIVENIKKTNYSIVNVEIARTTIPSNTHLNSFEVNNNTIFKISDLDELAHKGHYIKNSTLIDEIETVQRIINQIIEKNKVGFHTIAIVSDHGLSALSRKCPSKKLDAKTKHEGRYILLDENAIAYSDTDFIIHKNERDGKRYKVALTHSSLGNLPSHEVHGGCTPEEVLVPFIIITNNNATKPVEYKIKIISKDIPISDVTLSFIINPEPLSADIVIDGVKHKLEYSEMKWSYKAKEISEGEHTVTIIPYKGMSQSFSVNIYGMSLRNTLQDFDFE